MKFFKKLLLFIISAVLVLVLVLLSEGFVIKSTLLNQQFMEKELKKLNISSMLMGGIKKGLEEKVVQETSSLKESTPEALSSLMKAVFTDDWADEQIHLLLNNLYAYIRGETTQIKLVISTVEIKDKLLAELRARPEIISPLFKDNPKEAEKFLAQIETEFLAEFPSEINLLNESADLVSVINGAKEIAGHFNLVFWSLIGLSLILFLLAFLIIRNLVGWAKFTGRSFLTAGAANLAAAIFLSGYLAREVEKARVPPEFITKEALLEVLRDFIVPVYVYSVVYILIGVLLGVASYLIWRRIHQKPVETAI